MLALILSVFTDLCTGCGVRVCPDCGACPRICDC